MNTLPLKLNPLEIIYLTDSINLNDVAEGLPDTNTYIPLARDVLLLLGSVYKEVVTPAGIHNIELEIEITEEMAWLLRSKVKTGSVAFDGTTNIGIPLLLKLYDMIIRFNSGIVDLEVCEDIDPEVNEGTVEFLVFLKEHNNARAKPSTDTNSD